jgi:RNA polymerase sigma-70 factor, ECF subfamily
MARYADGHEPSFEVVYDALAPRLLGFLMLHTRNAALADDLLQQTFLQMHRGRASFKPGAPILPWAMAIARRLAIDDARRARFQPQPADERMARAASGAPHPDAIVSALQLADRVRDELRRLPESQRTAFLLIRSEGLSTVDAASLLGTTVSGVKLRVFRASETLRAQLGEMFERDGAY